MTADDQTISEAVDALADQIDVDHIEDEAARLGIPAADLINRLANELKMLVTGDGG